LHGRLPVRPDRLTPCIHCGGPPNVIPIVISDKREGPDGCSPGPFGWRVSRRKPSSAGTLLQRPDVLGLRTLRALG